MPKTAENFRALCTGERGTGVYGKYLCYKGVNFHKGKNYGFTCEFDYNVMLHSMFM